MVPNVSSNISELELICPKDPEKHINTGSGIVLLVVYIMVLSFNSLIIFVIFG